MTRQIVIKLNEKKFKPVLENLEKNGWGPVKSHSEFVGKVLFFEYLLWNEKCKELEDKTRIQFLMSKLDETPAEFMKCFLSHYMKFILSGNKEDTNQIKKCSGKEHHS